MLSEQLGVLIIPAGGAPDRAVGVAGIGPWGFPISERKAMESENGKLRIVHGGESEPLPPTTVLILGRSRNPPRIKGVTYVWLALFEWSSVNVSA